MAREKKNAQAALHHENHPHEVLTIWTSFRFPLWGTGAITAFLVILVLVLGVCSSRWLDFLARTEPDPSHRLVQGDLAPLKTLLKGTPPNRFHWWQVQPAPAAGNRFLVGAILTERAGRSESAGLWLALDAWARGDGPKALRLAAGVRGGEILARAMNQGLNPLSDPELVAILNESLTSPPSSH